MVFNTYFLDVLQYKFANFSGRARRSEYWFFMLFKWIILMVLTQLTSVIGNMTTSGKVVEIIPVLYFLMLIIPSVAVSVRRLHDTGNSGWMLLLNIIPIIGAIILLVFYFLDSNHGTNRYGRSPHEIVDDLSDHLI